MFVGAFRGTFWPLGVSFEPLGGVLGPLLALFLASWGLLEPSRTPLGVMLALLARFWLISYFWVPFGGHDGSFLAPFFDIVVWGAFGGQIRVM